MIDIIGQWLDEGSCDVALLLVQLGAILSLSIFADAIASRTRIPRISLLILIGVGIALIQQLYLGQPAGRLLGELGEPLIQLALVMVAFLLGSELTLQQLRETGRLVLLISLSVLFIGGFMVGAGLLLLGFPLVVAVALAAISVATDPAAVTASVQEVENDKKEKSPTAKVLLGIVAIDDGWGIIVFGLAMALLAGSMDSGHGYSVMHAFWELGGALLLGIVIGFPASWLTGRLRPGEPTQVEALAIIFLLTGLSSLLNVSELLAAMTTGTIIANFSSHHRSSFKEIEHIEWPFLVFFFVLSGASLDYYQLDDALWLTLAYILLRLAGRGLGGLVGTAFTAGKSGGPPAGIGLALTPQAGVAIGMALLAAERYPEYRDQILPAVVASTVVFELLGPMLVRRVLR